MACLLLKHRLRDSHEGAWRVDVHLLVVMMVRVVVVVVMIKIMLMIDDGHPENKTDLGKDQLQCAYVDVVDVSHAKLPVKVFRPQQLQVSHHKLPQLQDIVPSNKVFSDLITSLI